MFPRSKAFYSVAFNSYCVTFASKFEFKILFCVPFETRLSVDPRDRKRLKRVFFTRHLCALCDGTISMGDQIELSSKLVC